MAQLRQVVEPFGEVNVYPAANNKTRVVATILMEPYKEGAQTGIALDGSGSMRKLYGVDDGSGVVSPLFKKKSLENEIAPVAQQLCAYLARKIDADGGTTCIYWAVGPAGSDIQEIGDFTADEAERYPFGPPAEFGTGTYLLPAVRYFVDRFRDAPWGCYVFITDGELFDLQEVKAYTTQLARDIAARRRNPLKLILIGLGHEVNERQMEELDDLETGTDLDLWDHKLASELRMLQEIFAEVVDKNARVADNGKILDSQGNIIKNYSDTGLPAYLEFEVPNGHPYFTLEVDGNRIHQALYDQAQVPASTLVAPPQRSSATPPPLPRSQQGATPPPMPTETAETLHEVDPDDLIEDAGEIKMEGDELWKLIDLQKAEDAEAEE